MKSISILLVLAIAGITVNAQMFPIPSSPPGISFGHEDANFTLTAYYDLLCPDSRQSYYELN